MALLLTAAGSSAVPWRSWIANLGHDTYAYPSWVNDQIASCECSAVGCFAAPSSVTVDWRAAPNLTYCVAKSWLLEHMPEFDKHFLPPSIAVNMSSMLDDHISFALMADAAAPWSASVPLAAKLAYLLPYAAYHEARQNWRPLLFAKFFAEVERAPTVADAVQALIAPNVFTNWTGHAWADAPPPPPGADYQLHWSSSTNPPVVAPLDFVAYGYGSCTAWATLLAYAAQFCRNYRAIHRNALTPFFRRLRYTLRAVGVPARQAGTPCWNSEYSGVDYRGLASENENVRLCWHGGSAARGHGGGFLNNHNWVEYYDPADSAWHFVNVPPGTKAPDAGLCGDDFSAARGCGFNASAPPGTECDGVSGGPGAAMRDHEIFAATWSAEGEGDAIDGGPVVDGGALRLSSGEPASPLVWAPALRSPLGEPLKGVGLRFVNRTEHYRCKPTTRRAS